MSVCVSVRVRLYQYVCPGSSVPLSRLEYAYRRGREFVRVCDVCAFVLCVCVHISMCVFACKCARVCVRPCLCVCVCVCVCVLLCYVCVYVCISMCVCVCACVRVCLYVCV